MSFYNKEQEHNILDDMRKISNLCKKYKRPHNKHEGSMLEVTRSFLAKPDTITTHSSINHTALIDEIELICNKYCNSDQSNSMIKTTRMLKQCLQ